MAEQANDFIKDYQTLAQQSWDAWTRQQQPQANPFFTPPVAPASGNDTLERTLAGLKGYFDLMQGAAIASNANTTGDWRQQLQQMFGGASQPFSQAFSGIDGAGAESFARQWQSWMQAAQQGGFGDLSGIGGTSPAFGLNREQQMQQQTLATAVMESLQAAARYQSLIQRANAQGVERLQDKLTQHAEPGRQIDSPKALYDLWVDSAEEAYAEIALSDEFRDAYGEMVNSQMRVRQLQQMRTEQLCKELGVPTRSEVSSLGERLQQLRRDLRSNESKAGDAQAKEIQSLRRELDAVKQQLGAASASSSVRKSLSKPKTLAVKKAVSKPPAKKSGESVAPAKTKPAAKRGSAAVAKTTPRKRK
ncbi:poly(R)-hydroxyalkanoic acid synthase subunit PhaE [Rhodanobacter sp. L36]|uniref:poly(R)-hydroxyalkanoic acid synthase subunit PhaE n=1 Tax=Rhodanobacter sp. L36 TaxID=1747221 RepID=UPI00131B50AA|nr:poly(R)-hydroxyalkanoic acid synthase subunit PhaE [Rhodanobacter sp. L36]